MSGAASLPSVSRFAYEWVIVYQDGSRRSQFDAQGNEFSRFQQIDAAALFSNVRELWWQPRTELAHPYNQRFGFSVKDGQEPFFFRRGYLTSLGLEMFAYYIGHRVVTGDGSTKTWALAVIPPMQLAEFDQASGTMVFGQRFDGAIEEFSDINAPNAIERWQARSQR